MDSSDDKLEEFCESSEDSENPKLEYEEDFKPEKKEKKYQEMSFILGCLKNHFIFYNLSEAELENVAKKMFYCSVPMDQYIFTEGSKALCFFIIEKGMMQVITN
jgi:cGMP-dependent protein kinase